MHVRREACGFATRGALRMLIWVGVRVLIVSLAAAMV
jgi:hypothetical protein